MNLDTLFRISAYGLIGSGFAALVVTGGLDPMSVVLYTAAFVGSCFVDPRKLSLHHPRWSAWMFQAYLFFYLLDLFFISADFLVATVHLVLFTSALKLFTLKSDRDYVFLFLISFTQLVAASTLTISISFLATLSLFLLASVSALILFEIRRSLAESQRTVQILPTGVQTGFTLDVTRRFQVPAFFGTALLLTLLILLIAVPVFFTLPRLQTSFLGRNPGDAQFLSGFSDRVILGELGNIKKNTTVVMRVRLDRPPSAFSPNMKWRGIALDKYDGRGWSQSLPEKKRLEKPPGQTYFSVSQEPYRGRLLAQTFFLQPVNTNVLFALNRPTALSEEASNSLQSLYRDRMGSLSRDRGQAGKLRYTVWSDVYVPPPERLREAPIPLSTEAPAVRAYFDVPAIDPRIRTLAETITSGLSNPYDKARQIEQYLKNGFVYSLDMAPNAGTADPLAAFLFNSKQGHCEYFASAMAIMLRCIGIPSRIVNGFQAGEYNELGRDFIVRQSNAHTWVEAFFPGESWVEFDPTPPDPVLPRQPWVTWMGKFFDAVDLYWEEHFIRYNLWRQVQLFAGLRSALLRTAARVTLWALRAKVGIEDQLMNWETALTRMQQWRMFAWAASVLGLGALLFSRRHKLRHLLWKLQGKSDRLKKAIVLEFYAAMLEILKKRGRVKPPSSTALEFAESLRGVEVYAGVSALTDIYYRLRFRGDPASEERLREIRQLLQTIRLQVTS